MANQWIELSKLIAAIATPFVIAFVGILINKTIQKQNATAQRQSSWLAKWAEDFLKVSSEFDDAATSFVLVWWSSHLKTLNKLPGYEAELDVSVQFLNR